MDEKKPNPIVEALLKASGQPEMSADERRMRAENPLAADLVYGRNLGSMMNTWRLNAPDYTVDPTSGNVPNYAAPAQIAPPLDRQSQNIIEPKPGDSLISVLAPLAGKVINVSHKLNRMFEPTVRLDDISKQLPKQRIPWMGGKQ